MVTRVGTGVSSTSMMRAAIRLADHWGLGVTPSHSVEAVAVSRPSETFLGGG